MKKFTVKDFIAYNNPCFSCARNIHFNIIDDVVDIDVVGTTSRRPLVTPEFTLVDLKITYNDTLQLQIFHRTNRFTSTNLPALSRYLQDHKLRLSSRCEQCYTSVESEYIDFNMEKGYVGPVTIRNETLIVTDDRNRYHVHSYFHTNESLIIVDRIDRPLPLTPVKLQTPLLPLYKFKDKAHFINKMKTYLIFS